jgi:hypothetical protein
VADSAYYIETVSTFELRGDLSHLVVTENQLS